MAENVMTVGELVARLLKMPQSLPVCYAAPKHDYVRTVDAATPRRVEVGLVEESGYNERRVIDERSEEERERGEERNLSEWVVIS